MATPFPPVTDEPTAILFDSILNLLVQSPDAFFGIKRISAILQKPEHYIAPYIHNVFADSGVVGYRDDKALSDFVIYANNRTKVFLRNGGFVNLLKDEGKISFRSFSELTDFVYEKRHYSIWSAAMMGMDKWMATYTEFNNWDQERKETFYRDMMQVGVERGLLTPERMADNTIIRKIFATKKKPTNQSNSIQPKRIAIKAPIRLRKTLKVIMLVIVAPIVVGVSVYYLTAGKKEWLKLEKDTSSNVVTDSIPTIKPTGSD